MGHRKIASKPPSKLDIVFGFVCGGCCCFVFCLFGFCPFHERAPIVGSARNVKGNFVLPDPDDL